MIHEELALIEAGDRAGFKYSWSASTTSSTSTRTCPTARSFMAYAFARTKRIHVGSAIFNITPPVNHPARIAERVAMLDHLGEGRFEFGTGRGLVVDGGVRLRHRDDGAHPRALRRVAAPDRADVGRGRVLRTRAQSSRCPPVSVLPKPYTDPHPPIWVAAGSPGTFEKAARLGIGVLCFTLGTPDTLAPLIEIYKKNIDKAEPVGGYVNDNIMVTGDMMCLDDGDRARAGVRAPTAATTTPVWCSGTSTRSRAAQGFPMWPDLPPDPTVEELKAGRSTPLASCVGDPDEISRRSRGSSTSAPIS